MLDIETEKSCSQSTHDVRSIINKRHSFDEFGLKKGHMNAPASS